MKKTIQISSLLLLLLLNFTGNSQVSAIKVITSPIEYNDYIVGQQNLIGRGILTFIDVFGDTLSTREDAIEKLDQVIKTASDAIDNLNNLKTLDSDYGLKEKAISLFDFYKRILGTSYLSIVYEVFSSIPDPGKIDELVASVSAEEAGYDEAYATSQQKFAAANNITLEKNELEDQFR